MPWDDIVDESGTTADAGGETCGAMDSPELAWRRCCKCRHMHFGRLIGRHWYCRTCDPSHAIYGVNKLGEFPRAGEKTDALSS